MRCFKKAVLRKVFLILFLSTFCLAFTANTRAAEYFSAQGNRSVNHSLLDSGNPDHNAPADIKIVNNLPRENSFPNELFNKNFKVFSFDYHSGSNPGYIKKVQSFPDDIHLFIRVLRI